MANERNKNSSDSRVPPGAKPAPSNIEDAADMIKAHNGTLPDRSRVCTCCGDIIPAENWLTYLFICETCANECDDAANCMKNLCQCPGGCCADHKEGEKCTDVKALLIGKIGRIVLEVCTACAIELAKKAAGL